MRRALRWTGGAVALAALFTACQERLTSPADCPALCPGGSPTVFDEVVDPIAGRDESITGYVARGGGPALLVSDGLPGSEDRAVYKFTARADSITVRDTLRQYDVDSVAISLTLVARDTLVSGLKLILYRLPGDLEVDTATFAGIDPQLADANLIDTIAVPDSVRTGSVRTVIRGADVSRVAIPPGTGGVLAVGLRMTAAAPTGVRLGSLAGSTGASFTSFVTVDVPDTGSTKQQTLSRSTGSNTFVAPALPAPDPDLLVIGGEPSSRTILRFALPSRILDSATISRATLELVPAGPLPGLPGDPATLEAHAVLSDLGAKSPLATDPQLVVQDTLAVGSADTVRLDIIRIVRLWQASRDRPQAVFLLLRPEAATFTRASFGSTRTPAVGAPRLRIAYQLSFPFENP